MKSVINRGPLLMADACCGTNWLTKKTFNLVFVDDDTTPPAESFLLMEDNTSYILLEDNVSKIELE